MNFFKPLALMAISLSITGCVPQNRYNWVNYDQSIYDFYRDNSDAAKFSEAIKTVIDANESQGKKVPPGIYAEYGFQLLSANQIDEAVTYFEKEKSTWPEANKFMDVLVKYARSGGKLKDELPVKDIEPRPTRTENKTKAGA